MREHEPLADHEPVGELVEGEDLRHPVDDVRLSDLLALENGNLLGELVEGRRDRGMDLAGTEHGEVRARPHERAHERQGLYLRPRESMGEEASVDEDPRLGRPRGAVGTSPPAAPATCDAAPNARWTKPGRSRSASTEPTSGSHPVTGGRSP